jgi:glycosyltransferase involved in cell wall biosynthesis
MYRHVDVLNANGISSTIYHQQDGFRVTWFANQTRVAYPAEAWPPKTSDILLVPELFIWQFASMAPGVPKVVFNQNAYQTFRGQSVTHHVLPYWQPDCIASIVVSEDSRRYLEFAFPGHSVFRVHNSIDPALFHFQSEKKRQIAFMPRKNGHNVAQVVNLLNCRGKLNGFELIPIEGKSEAEVARILGDSMIFLSFSTQEGCPMPPLEAMACGCITVGYDGFGGSEYFNRGHAVIVKQEDVIGFTVAVEQTIARLDSDPNELRQLARSASEFVLGTYTPLQESEDIIETWRQILAIPRR